MIGGELVESVVLLGTLWAKNGRDPGDGSLQAGLAGGAHVLPGEDGVDGGPADASDGGQVLPLQAGGTDATGEILGPAHTTIIPDTLTQQ
ncbi:MAG TPA: hypothetical protein PLN42_12115 [Anaerolineae bacterium]|nr:hypothetical protein [Anaerolineae bacterium]